MESSDIVYLLLPFVLTLVLGAPICAALSLGTIIFMLITEVIPCSMMTMQMFSQVSSLPLMAIPFFIFAGDLMNETGVSQRLIDFCKVLFQHLRGGLAYAIVVTGTLFAGLTGSAVAETAALVKIMTPTMKREGYPAEFTAALCATTGILGPIIPPSILFIVYGATMNVSVGALFLGGVLPGLLMGGAMLATVIVIASIKRFPKSEQPFRIREVIDGIKDASFSLFMPVLLMGGIRFGIFTPTEGGAVAASYALFLGVFVYRTVTLRQIFNSAISSGVTAAVILLIISATTPFGWIVTIGGFPAQIAEIAFSMSRDPLVILLGINILLFFMGMFMETTATVLLLGPVLAPIAVGVGLDPVHFAMIMCVNLVTGMITPPVGMTLFVAAPIAGISFGLIVRAVMPFIFSVTCSLVLINVFPGITLWLPSVLK